MANNLIPESAKGKIKLPKEICSNEINGSGSGINAFTVCEKINATAATEAQPKMVKSVQPNKKEKKLPNDKRRYSYTPPDSSVNEDKPESVKAPNKVMTPAMTHAINIQVSLRPVCAMGIIFLKTPEPIIVPATNNIPVNSPSVRINGILVLLADVSFSFTTAIFLLAYKLVKIIFFF